MDHTSPYLPSHWGPSVSFNNHYLIEIEQVSNFDPKNPKGCKDYKDNEFENCINDPTSLFLPILGCNPPWYSTQNVCTSVVNEVNETYSSIIYDYLVFNLFSLDSQTFWNGCPKHCTVTQSKIQPKA